MPAETHTNQGPLDRQGVFELIRDQLADILETDPSSITEGASFVEDLDADSLALIELVEALEEELGERTRRVPHRRRGPRGPAHGPRRRRLRRTPSSRGVEAGAEGAADTGRATWRTASATSSLLRQALAHRSWCGEQEGGAPSNERLEFLGDAVLGLVVAGYTFGALPRLRRGEAGQGPLGRRQRPRAGRGGRRARRRRGPPARQGEEGSGGRTKASILADAFEAVIGAVYLDAGWEAARAAGAAPAGRAHRAGRRGARRLRPQEPAAGDGGARAATARRATWWPARGPTTTGHYEAEVYLSAGRSGDRRRAIQEGRRAGRPRGRGLARS